MFDYYGQLIYQSLQNILSYLQNHLPALESSVNNILAHSGQLLYLVEFLLICTLWRTFGMLYRGK